VEAAQAIPGNVLNDNPMNKAVIFFSCWLVFAQAFGQKPVPELWNLRVHDDAHALKQETVERLEQQLKLYEDSTTNQIAILIISSLESESIEDYSIRVAEKWQLGQKGKDNGVLLLIAIDDHEMRIEVGYGLEGVLTDVICNRIIRNEMAPAFRRGDFDGGVSAAIVAITQAIGGEYKAEDVSEFTELTTREKLLIGLGLYLFLGIFAFFGLVTPGCTGWGLYVFLIPFYTLFPMMLVSADSWYVPGVLYIVLFPILKLWIGNTAWGKRIGKKMSNSRSGGGWSSWSSGSGGWSSGGGGFSGGGGSFGGGGSSGRW
jgi:uncharacterized protein